MTNNTSYYVIKYTTDIIVKNYFFKEPGFKEIRLVRNWSGKSKGYGYVDFDSAVIH